MHAANKSFFAKWNLRVEVVDEDGSDLDDVSQQIVNLFIKYAKKKASGSYQQQLVRALLKKFGIKFPIKDRKQPGI